MGFSSSTLGKEPGCQCIREAGSVSGLGRSPGAANATHSSILASSIPWIGEPGRLRVIWLQNSRT